MGNTPILIQLQHFEEQHLEEKSSAGKIIAGDDIAAFTVLNFQRPEPVFG